MGPAIKPIEGENDLVIAFLNDFVESVTKKCNLPPRLSDRILCSSRLSNTTSAVASPESTRLTPSPNIYLMAFLNIG